MRFRMRTYSSSVMVALVVVALFWGNCFTCPQVLLALQTHQEPHGCCHKTRQPAGGCQTQVLGQFVKVDSGNAVAPLPTVAVVAPLVPMILAVSPTAIVPVE